MDHYVLTGSIPDYIDNDTSSPLLRYKPLTDWSDARYDKGVEPYSKYTSSAIASSITAHGRKGDKYSGINFASQDYLNLATHPEVLHTAKSAIDEYGVHSAGSAALMGSTIGSIQLEQRIAEFTGYKDCTLFPTGWSAGYGIIRALTRPSDHIVIDVLSHACLHEGARAATNNVNLFPHLSMVGLEKRLKRIRQKDANNSIIVVVESLFSMDSDIPDLVKTQDLCNEYSATLIVDCAHDLGSIAETGRGALEFQSMIGKVDVLMGSFSKTFASNGGFVATNATELKLGLKYLCGPNTFSNAMSPASAALVHKCFDIVESPEGKMLREKLLDNSKLLRSKLAEHDFEVIGEPSAIVPVVLGVNSVSRLATKYALEHGGVVNLIEYPAVARGTSRWRLQVMAEHTNEQICEFVEIAVDAREYADSAAQKLDADAL